MPAQNDNLLWDYSKVNNEDVSKAVCMLCKKNLSRGCKDPLKISTTKVQDRLKYVHNSEGLCNIMIKSGT